MKRIICLITALCIVLSSFSFAFAADWSTTDQNNLQSIKNAVNSAGGLYNMIANINSALSFSNISLANIAQNIYNSLNYQGHSAAYWLETINANVYFIASVLDPNSNTSLSGILNNILNALVYTNAGGAAVSFLNDLRTENQIQSNLLSNLYNYGFVQNVSPVTVSYGKDSTSIDVGVITLPWNQAILYSFNELRGSLGRNYVWTNDKMYENAESNQSYVNWSTLNSSTFTPASGIDGIYKYLSYIQNPVARLSYVLASDERIEAQELAADNEQAVIDNFIDPTGSGSASTSDFGSISDLSSGYQNNFGSSASVTGIFNIFDSNNFGWFSQETANQLDTSSNNSRAKSGFDFETPLLDQKIEDIYDALGVKP